MCTQIFVMTNILTKGYLWQLLPMIVVQVSNWLLNLCLRIMAVITMMIIMMGSYGA